MGKLPEQCNDWGWRRDLRFAGREPEPSEREAVLEGLAKAAGFFRSRVARSMATRITPELRFVADRGAEHAARIDAILAGLREPPPEEAP